ncbi:MAG: hypothetical protein ABI681_11015 [Gemmatimonadales bacterium]
MSKFMLPQAPATSRDQLREQIRQTVKDAQAAAEEAAKTGAQQGQGRNVIVFPNGPTPPTPPGIPTTGVQGFPDNVIPPQAVDISIAFFIMIGAIIIGLPLMRAIARRIERGTPVAAPLPPEVRDQLQQISQSVDAIAIEVERISEGQRFTTKMLADRSREGTTITPGSAAQ